MQTDWYWNQDAEGRDDLIRLEIEESGEYTPWTQEVSDMYAELDLEDRN